MSDGLPSRFFIITGKGGVGKSILAQSLTLKLKEEGMPAELWSFGPSEALPSKDLKGRVIDFEDNAAEYMAMKLGSQKLAHWVASTYFFKSLGQMVPSFHYLLAVGKAVDELQKRPNLHIVLDAPSSGHVKSMIESIRIFKKIFIQGTLKRDIEKLEEAFFFSHLAPCIYVVSHFESLAISESSELLEDLKLTINETSGRESSIETSMRWNKSLARELGHLDAKCVPSYLKELWRAELEIRNRGPWAPYFPLILSHKHTEIVEELKDFWKNGAKDGPR